jgi:hypothetical protein
MLSAQAEQQLNVPAVSETKEAPSIRTSQALARFILTAGSLSCLAAGAALGGFPYENSSISYQRIIGSILGVMGTEGLITSVIIGDPETNSEHEEINQINCATKNVRLLGFLAMGAIYMHAYMSAPKGEAFEERWEKIMQEWQQQRDLVMFPYNAPLYL